MVDFFKKLFGFSRLQPASAGRTDIGLVRENNEDGFLILSEQQLFLLADGMGGHQAGEVASQAALQTVAGLFSPETMRGMQGRQEEIHHFMVNAIRHANEAVMAMAAADPEKQGMGCTFIAGLIDQGYLHTCHVGDTRCYLAGAEHLEQLTADHSRLAEFQRLAAPGDNSLSRTVSRHVVSRAIGFPFDEDPEYHSRIIRPGDRFLFCSDGLWSMVDDQHLHGIVRDSSTPEQACDQCISQANENGGRDNITAVIVFC